MNKKEKERRKKLDRENSYTMTQEEHLAHMKAVEAMTDRDKTKGYREYLKTEKTN